MELPPFAVVDLETSGFSTRRHRILQLGLVVVEADGTPLDEWTSLIGLRWPFGRVGPTHVHGITRPMLRGAPPLDVVLDELGERIDGAIFTAHNAGFDGGFLVRATRRLTTDGSPTLPANCVLVSVTVRMAFWLAISKYGMVFR